jgi:hypothetical protein
MEEDKIWSAFGLNPQAFPIYYPMGPASFLDSAGTPSGAAGAVAQLSRDLSNFPHMFLGLRVSNQYALPTTPTADQVNLYRTCKEWIDGEQSVRVELAQQSIAAERVPQTHLTGREAIHWHPFPVPFPMAGANTISVVITRLTSYPQLAGASIIPTVSVSILAAVMRADLKAIAPHRVGPR